MNAQQAKNKQGFTIIEVVLVLAIAALIFLMVFLALPALQRNQRDTQRQENLSRVVSQLTTFQSNNRGALPATTNDAAGNTAYGTRGNLNPPAAAAATSFLERYLTRNGEPFDDPSGKPYSFEFAPAAGLPTTSDATDNTRNAVRIFYQVGTTCAGEGVTTGQGNRKVSFRLVLEGSGVACRSN